MMTNSERLHLFLEYPAPASKGQYIHIERS